MSTQARSYVVRLSAEGKRQLERDLKAVGVSGEKSLALIQKAAKPASKALKQTDSAARGVKAGLRSITQELPALQRLSRFMGTAALAGGLVAFGRSSLDVAKNFQAAMKRVEAVTSATGDEMEQLSAKALAMGASTAFTASQAADAIEVLAKNGLSVTEILGGALDGTLALAGALGGELAPSADLVTDLMQQFKLEARELPAIADAVAGAALTSKFGFNDLRLAIGQAGGVAGSAGIDYQEFLTSISATASAFSSGQDAGTSFKTFLQRLVPQSNKAKAAMVGLNLEFFDGAGNMKTMAEVAEELKQGVAGLSDEARSGALQEIFGTDAIRTALMLADIGGEGFRDLAAGIGQVSAQDQAEVRLEGLEGALKELAAAWEALQLEASMNGGLDVAEASVDRFTTALRFLKENFAEVDEIVQRVAHALVAVLVGRGIKFAIAQGVAMRAAYVELASSVVGTGTAAGRALGPLTRLGLAGRAITGMLGGPIGLAMTAASLLALGLDTDVAADAIENADEVSGEATEALRLYADAAQQAGEDQDTLSGKVSATTAEMVRQGRVAVQMALEAAQAAQRELLATANGDGLLNGDHIGRMMADVFQIAQAEWTKQMSTGPKPEFDVDAGAFVNLGPVFADMFEAIEALRTGDKTLAEISETLRSIAGAGQEVISITELMDKALLGASDVDLESVRDRMREIAEGIGIFDAELASIGEANSEFELLQAYELLRTAMLNAAAAGRLLRDTGEDGLLALVASLAGGEAKIKDLTSALEGTWSAAQERSEKTFVSQIEAQATAAADELERMDRAFGSLSRRQEFDPNSTDRGAYQRSEIEAAQKGILDLIGQVEGTDKGRGYNETLGYGAFTDGPVNLINMTLSEIRDLQAKMLDHPDNTFNSSAVGRYQIVGTTLQGLMEKLNLSGDELFDSKIQDRLGMELVRRRMPQGRDGFYNEWDGFKKAGTPWSTIQTGLGSQSISRLDPGVQRANEAAAEARRRATKEQEAAQRTLLEAGQQQISQLELEALLIGKTASEQARLTYIHEALTQAKAAGIDVETQLSDTGERYIDVIIAQADAIAKRTEEQRKSLGLSDEEREGLQESQDAVKSAFDGLKRQGEGWQGVMDSLIDHMIQKLWDAAFDPVWDFIGGLMDTFLDAIIGGIGGNASGGPLKRASGGSLNSYAAGGTIQMGGRAAGLLPGQGHRRQDNILFWGSPQEFVQPGDAVDYYGVEFMEAIRQRRLPRYAEGGLIGGGASTSGSGALGAMGPSPMAVAPVQQGLGVVKVEVTVVIDGARGDQEMRDMVEAGVEVGVSDAFEKMDQALPERFAQIQSDRRARL